jgi:hypothetical protein
MVRLVARRVSYGLFVAGQGGMGKSRTIRPVLINLHITPLSLYTTLFNRRVVNHLPDESVQSRSPRQHSTRTYATVSLTGSKSHET